MSNIVKTDSQGKIHLYDFVNFLDVHSVKFYCVKPNKDGTISIKFYDKNRKLVKPYVK